MDNQELIAKHLYGAYVLSVMHLEARALPAWDDLSNTEREHWLAVAQTAISLLWTGGDVDTGKL